MPIDLFEQHGVDLNNNKNPVDLFERHGINPNEKKMNTQGTEKNLLDKFNDVVHNYIGEPARAATAGLGQGIEHALASAINLPLQLSGSKSRVPLVDLSKKFYGQPHTALAFSAGNLAGNVLPGAGATGLISKTLGGNSLLKDALAGAASGVITGAQEEDDNSSRLIGGLLGGVAPTLIGISKPALAKKIVEKERFLNKELEADYNNIFNTAKERGLSDKHLFAPRTAAQIERKAPTAAKESLKDFIANPTLEQAHQTQSDLGKVLRKMEQDFMKRSKTNRVPLSSEEKDFQAIEKLRGRIQDGMQNFLKRNSSEDIGESYIEAGERYAREYGPYLESSIKQYKSGDINSSKLIKALQDVTKKPYKGKLYSEIKGFEQRKNLQPFLDALKYAGLGTGAFYGLQQILPHPAAHATSEAISHSLLK